MYKLEGFDREWSAPTSSRKAVFGKLSPGKYVFKVRASFNEINWSEAASYSFSIRPPWWKTWLAYLVYLIIAGAIIYAYIQLKVNREVEKIRVVEKLRNKISADLHDDVGSILTGIAMQSEFLSMKKSDDLENEMTSLSAMSRDAMEKMRDIVWALDSSKSRVINLLDKMKYHATTHLSKSRFKHAFQVGDATEELILNPEQKQNIYLIFKESIANVLKHSNGDKVSIALNLLDSNLELIIHDNGTKKEKLKSEGVGMRNIQARAHALDATLAVKSDDGFTVSLTVPLR